MVSKYNKKRKNEKIVIVKQFIVFTGNCTMLQLTNFMCRQHTHLFNVCSSYIIINFFLHITIQILCSTSTQYNHNINNLYFNLAIAKKNVFNPNFGIAKFFKKKTLNTKKKKYDSMRMA